MSTKTITSLNQLLADSFVLYTKTLNYHWHVKGPHFYPLHQLFEEQYTDLAAAIDQIAERVVILGGQATGRMKDYLELTSINEADDGLTPQKMVEQLAQDQEKIVRSCYQVIEAAQGDNDEGTTDLAVGRSRVHQKNGWMLKSSVS